MPLTPDRATFFSAELAALAALPGFVVVAISINLARILSYPQLPARASEALIGPVGALMGDEPRPHTGAAIDAVGRGSRRGWSRHGDGFSSAFIVAGVVLFAGARAGLYWIAAGDILCIVAIVLRAWVLMVEILR